MDIKYIRDIWTSNISGTYGHQIYQGHMDIDFGKDFGKKNCLSSVFFKIKKCLQLVAHNWK